MATLNSIEQKNKLELYLNDVYEKECEFKIEHEEIEFIQTGIETLVQDLVDHILKDVAFDKLISDQIDAYDTINSLNKDKSSVEIYFPIQSGCSLQRYVTENASRIKVAKSTIIKVGSFYDGTKNSFPDEFDFIFPILGTWTHHTYLKLSGQVVYTLVEAISEYGLSLHFPPKSEGHQETRELYLKKTGVFRHGPAWKIQFIYSNRSGEQRPIHVDLVPAYKMIDCNKQQWFGEEARQHVEPKTFLEEILSARNCLNVDSYIAFTEIEQHFIKNILSRKHVKVYRILKYILNGNGDGEKLEEDIREKSECIYTSYRIKILMIYHHESCINTGTEYLGPCVLQVLKEMSKYKSRDKFPSFTWSIHLTSPYKDIFCVLPNLKSTIRTMQSMQTSEEDYNYERDKIKSVSGQYIDRETRQDQTSEVIYERDTKKSVSEQYMDRETRQDQTSEDSKEKDKIKSV